MPGFETLLIVLVAAVLALGALALFASLRASAASDAMAELGAGRFAEALRIARTGPKAPRDEVYAAAVAAKHLGLWERADELLNLIVGSRGSDPGDGEAWLERGAVASYSGRAEEATAAFTRALSGRSDLAESITLHRAWLALSQGDTAAARRLFDEVEAPLESKLRSDLGEGDPLFAEWFLLAAVLWRAQGDAERAGWAAAAGRAAAPESRLPEVILAPAVAS